MPDLLLELFSEEIPARMQRRAADDLRKLVTDALVERGFLYEGAKAFATPRRLALHIAGLPAKGQDVREERKGPRVGAPDAAIQGFLKGAGLLSLDRARIDTDPKKGEFYVAVIERPGRPTQDALTEILPGIIRNFPWPKSMRWGVASREPGSLRWVRPLHSIVCTFGPETETPEVVPFSVEGIVAGDVTRGHRFMAPDAFPVRRFDDYVSSLERAKVVLDADRRKDVILAEAKTLAFAQGLELIEDEALLEEVAGLVEWPVVLMGAFDEAFLDIPPEVIRATIRANHKCFVLRESSPLEGEGGRRMPTGRGGGAKAATGASEASPSSDLASRGHLLPPGEKEGLSNRFVLVANLEASDGGAAIVAGNERVVRARLSDAKFFWETDRKTRLEDRLEKLKSIVFHEKLGTQYERIERIAALATELAPVVGADPELAWRAARLAKADLVTEMVGEFPELQGLMGRYYADAQGEDPSVAAAIEEHYKPLGPSDRVPTDPVSVAVALADKIDTLLGFWAIDEKPTGSKDPYALRRAALGVIRLVLENALPLSLRGVFVTHSEQSYGLEYRGSVDQIDSLCFFFADRLKVQLREQGASHDLVDAIEALSRLGQGERLVPIVRRVEALGQFLDTEDGRNLLAGYRRAANILRIEEKKDSHAYDTVPEIQHLKQVEELALWEALVVAGQAAQTAVAAEDFGGAMLALSQLRGPVDHFFEKVTVNADDPALRANRLKLLNALRAATREVADFSKIDG